MAKNGETGRTARSKKGKLILGICHKHPYPFQTTGKPNNVAIFPLTGIQGAEKACHHYVWVYIVSILYGYSKFQN